MIDRRPRTSTAVTPADSHVTVVLVVATGDDVIVTWPAGARLVATTSRHGTTAVHVAVTAPMASDVTVAAAVRGSGGEDDAVDGHAYR